MADVEPSLWDLQNLIERNHQAGKENIADLKAQLGQDLAQVGRDVTHISAQLASYLPREVYLAKEETRQAERAGELLRIARLEEERAEIRRSNRTATLSAVSAVVAAIAMVIIDQLVKG